MSATSAIRLILICVALGACVWGATAIAGELGSNPADKRYFKNRAIEDTRYDHATRCQRGGDIKRGTKKLKRWLERVSDQGAYWGGVRCEKFSKGNYSIHSQGRAIDWHLDARDRSEREEAQKLIRTWLERDRWGNEHALARRMGIQGIIFNCRAWFGWGGMGPYSVCYNDNGKRKKGVDPTQAHKDHIHIELNKPGGSARTSFWRSPYAP